MSLYSQYASASAGYLAKDSVCGSTINKHRSTISNHSAISFTTSANITPRAGLNGRGLGIWLIVLIRLVMIAYKLLLILNTLS